MTITLNVTGNLVQQYENKTILGKGLVIKKIDITPKIEFDHGDCDCILILKYSTMLETIPALLHDYKFIRGETIKQLLITP